MLLQFTHIIKNRSRILDPNIPPTDPINPLSITPTTIPEYPISIMEDPTPPGHNKEIWAKRGREVVMKRMG